MNDAQTGYCSNFYLYEGKKEARPVGMAATTFPFYRLIVVPGQWNPEQYVNKNHFISTDNWFNSIPTITLCRRSGNHGGGTFRCNRGYPPHGVYKKSGPQMKERGTTQQWGRHVLETGDSYYYVSWMDNKPVHMVSTISSMITTVMRRVSVTVNGIDTWVEMDINQPTIVKIYNKGMGGTDQDDQKLSNYRPKVKTVSWAPKIFCHFLNSSLVNAYIIRIQRLGLNNRQYRHIEFLNNLIDQWTEPWLDRLAAGDAAMANMPRGIGLKRWNTNRSRLHGRHYPITNVATRQERAGERNANINRNLQRGFCVKCGDHCNVKCIQCGVYLCIKRNAVQLEIEDPSCWVKFHTYPDIFQDEEEIF